jgi:hypothetical protein
MEKSGATSVLNPAKEFSAADNQLSRITAIKDQIVAPTKELVTQYKSAEDPIEDDLDSFNQGQITETRT